MVLGPYYIFNVYLDMCVYCPQKGKTLPHEKICNNRNECLAVQKYSTNTCMI